jgi:transcriptional regulator with XRE-family HTH domain
MTHLPSLTPATVAISDDERAFFIQLGERITLLRKGQAITQVQLAEQLGVSQQTVTAYESGRRRVPISHLPRLAVLLGVSVETLIGQPATAASKRGPTPKLLQQLERLHALPRAKQRMVSEVLDSLLAQAGR